MPAITGSTLIASPTQSIQNLEYLDPSTFDSRLAGTYWAFVVDFVDQSGNAMDLTGLTPVAQLYPTWGASPYRLSVDPPDSGDLPNRVRFGLNTNPTTGGVLVPSRGFQSTFLNLVVVTRDYRGDDTPVFVRTLRVGFPSDPGVAVAGQQSALTSSGPRGDQGIPGIAASQAQIDQSVSAAIPGAVSAELSARGFPTTVQEFNELIEATVRAVVNDGIFVSGTVPQSAGASGTPSASSPQSGQVSPGASLSGSAGSQDQLSGSVPASAQATGLPQSDSGSATGAAPASASLTGSTTQSDQVAGSVPPSASASGSQDQTDQVAGSVPQSAQASGQPSSTVGVSGSTPYAPPPSGSTTQSDSVSGQVPSSAQATGQAAPTDQVSGQVPPSAGASTSGQYSAPLSGTVPGAQAPAGSASRYRRSMRRYVAFGLLGANADSTDPIAA